MRQPLSVVALIILLISGLAAAVLVVPAATQTASPAATCRLSVTEALQAGRIVNERKSYAFDSKIEAPKVFAYLRGGSRPSNAEVTTHMGKHLLALEDLCRELEQTPPTTTTAPPTTTTTTTTEPPPPIGFPNAANTGPTGTLTSSTGSFAVTTAGTVIQNRLINGCVEVLANNVTIRNSHIRCNSVNSAYGIRDIEGNSGLLIEDSIVECVNGVAGAGGVATTGGFTMRWSEVFGCENNVWVERDALIEDNYIHDTIPYNPQTDPHTDAIQMPTPTVNVTIRHNTVYGGYIDQSNFGNSAITTGVSTNVRVLNNLLAGGGHTLRCPAEHDTDFAWHDNHFSTIFVSTVGGFGPIDGNCQFFPHSGNVMHETGEPVG